MTDLLSSQGKELLLDSQLKRTHSYSSLQFSENSTRNSSLLEVKSNYKSLCKIPKSKIGYVKEGFWIFSNINPIGRYNFYIDRHNENISSNDQVHLKRVPLNSTLSFIYDLLCFICRLIFAVFFIVSSSIARIVKSKHYKTYYQYYSFSGSSTSVLEVKKKNGCLLFFSMILVLILVAGMVYYPIVALPPLLYAFLLTLYGLLYYIKNEKLVKGEFYTNMIFDEELDKTDKLNDYITITPGSLEEFSGYSYYPQLLSLYNRRDNTVPQQFMIYGNAFIQEKSKLVNIVTLQLVAIIAVAICAFINTYYL